MPIPPLEGRPINWTATVKYLGVRLDRHLNFNAHVTATLSKARGVRAKISTMLSRNSCLAVRTKLTLYLLFLRTVLTYAAPAWWPLLSATNRRRLSTFQNRTLRSLSGSPWFVRNSAIHRGLRVPTLEAFVWSLASNLFAKASESPYPHLQRPVSYTHLDVYKRQVVSLGLPSASNVSDSATHRPFVRCRRVVYAAGRPTTRIVPL